MRKVLIGVAAIALLLGGCASSDAQPPAESSSASSSASATAGASPQASAPGDPSGSPLPDQSSYLEPGEVTSTQAGSNIRYTVPSEILSISVPETWTLTTDSGVEITLDDGSNLILVDQFDVNISLVADPDTYISSLSDSLGIAPSDITVGTPFALDGVQCQPYDVVVNGQNFRIYTFEARGEYFEITTMGDTAALDPIVKNGISINP